MLPKYAYRTQVCQKRSCSYSFRGFAQLRLYYVLFVFGIATVGFGLGVLTADAQGEVFQVDLYSDNLRTDYTSAALECGESREVNLHQAVFMESPNFSLRKKYPNSINCKWNFRLNNCTLAISCPNFDLNKFLCLDYVEFTDGVGRTKRFCGNDGPQRVYLDKTVSVTFISSPSFSASGFRCYAVCVEPGPVTHTALAVSSIPYSTLGQCDCGRGNRASKYAQFEKFPWVAKLIRKSDRELFCSAIVLSNRYLISAAHCFAAKDTSNPEDIQVVILNGKLNETKQKNRSSSNGPRDVISINRFHGDGLALELDADVALLKLKDTIDFAKDNTSPVCLPKGEDGANHYSNLHALSSQWEWDSSWKGHQLLNMKSLVISNANCSDIHRTNSNNPFPSRASSPSIICARSSITNACHPISGAALMATENKGRISKNTLIGIGSWGYDCGLRKRMPQIYTRVTEIVDWILKNTQDSAFCKN